MVDGTGLENQRRLTPTAGSNPALSAKLLSSLSKTAAYTQLFCSITQKVIVNYDYRFEAPVTVFVTPSTPRPGISVPMTKFTTA